MPEIHEEGTRSSIYKTKGLLKASTGFAPLICMWALSDFAPISEPARHGNILAWLSMASIALFGSYVDARASTRENERGLDYIEIRSQMIGQFVWSAGVWCLFKAPEIIDFIHQLNTKH